MDTSDSHPHNAPESNPTLAQLLRQGDVWRGHSQVFSPKQVIASGYPALDKKLLNKGWPMASMIEFCLPSGLHNYAPVGGEWLLLTPAIKQLAATGAYLVLLNPPATPFASGLMQQGINLEQLLIVRSDSKQQFVASLVELSRSQHCSVLLAWQPKQVLTYTELRKCQLACAEGQGLYVLLRTRNSQNQSSPAPLRLQIQLQADSLQLDIFKQKGKLNTGRVQLSLPQSWLPHTAHGEQGTPHTIPATQVPAQYRALAVDKPTIVPLRSKPKLKRGYP